MMPVPTDEEIIAAASGRKATYVIRNILSERHKGIPTAWVLRQLKRLEKAGKVMRVPSSYAVQITWSVIDQSAQSTEMG